MPVSSFIQVKTFLEAVLISLSTAFLIISTTSLSVFFPASLFLNPEFIVNANSRNF